MPRKDAQFTVCVPPRNLRRLNELAKRDGRTRSNYVEQVLARHIRDVEGKAA
jgi:predicted DNA-binding protein